MVNDTMIRYSPESGYPVAEVKRRRRVVASPDGGLPHDPAHRRVTRWAMNILALAFGLAAVAWVGLGVAGHASAWLARDEAATVAAELDSQWGEPAASGHEVLPPSAATDFAPASLPAAGQAWGKLHVPSLGLTGAPIYQGTTSEQINVGIGHYTQTEFPWQAGGNIGLAGHRTGWEELFNRLDELQPGDKVYVETKEAFFEYTIGQSKVISPTDTWVLADVPGAATGVSGDSQLLTLTTCEGPDNEMRLAVWGEMTGVYDKSAGATPQALS